MRPFNSITWNGESSLKFGIRILDRDIPRPSPGIRYERIQIDGRDGDLIASLRSIPSVNYTLPINLLDTSRADEIVEWLRREPNGDLILSWDEDFVYKAAYIDSHELNTKLTKLGSADLMFIVHPWKYLASGQEEVTGTTVTNPTEYDAEPIYSISGTGNMDVLINGELIRLQNMTGTIIIDTEKDLVYGSGLGFQNVLTYPFPKLKPGENIFSHSITVQPNWRVRL